MNNNNWIKWDESCWLKYKFWLFSPLTLPCALSKTLNLLRPHQQHKKSQKSLNNLIVPFQTFFHLASGSLLSLYNWSSLSLSSHTNELLKDLSGLLYPSLRILKVPPDSSCSRNHLYRGDHLKNKCMNKDNINQSRYLWTWKCFSYLCISFFVLLWL